MTKAAPVTDLRRVLALLLRGVWLGLVVVAAPRPSAPDAPYTAVFYPRGALRIQADVCNPDGDGPFPVILSNHGSRAGRARVSVPDQDLGARLTRAGALVLVPERRGYGQSDGLLWRSEPNNQARLVPRLEEETADVLAALDYLRTRPCADTPRIGIMGWSFGGLVTMCAVRRSTACAAAVEQAGGALTWDGNAAVRRALLAAAAQATTPTRFLVAQNDRTTAAATTLAASFTRRRVPHRVLSYAPFTPAQGGIAAAPGHGVFSAQGAGVWARGVRDFLGRDLSGTSKGAPGGGPDPAKVPPSRVQRVRVGRSHGLRGSDESLRLRPWQSGGSVAA